MRLRSKFGSVHLLIPADKLVKKTWLRLVFSTCLSVFRNQRKNTCSCSGLGLLVAIEQLYPPLFTLSGARQRFFFKIMCAKYLEICLCSNRPICDQLETFIYLDFEVLSPVCSFAWYSFIASWYLILSLAASSSHF